MFRSANRITQRRRVLTMATGAVVALGMAAHADSPMLAKLSRPATPAEIKAWDIDVRPDFTGLPPGAGTVARGQEVGESRCENCHGTFGESNEVFTPIVGGTTADDVKPGTSPRCAATRAATHDPDESLRALGTVGLHQSRDAVEPAEEPVD